MAQQWITEMIEELSDDDRQIEELYKKCWNGLEQTDDAEDHFLRWVTEKLKLEGLPEGNLLTYIVNCDIGEPDFINQTLIDIATAYEREHPELQYKRCWHCHSDLPPSTHMNMVKDEGEDRTVCDGCSTDPQYKQKCWRCECQLTQNTHIYVVVDEDWNERTICSMCATEEEREEEDD